MTQPPASFPPPPQPGWSGPPPGSIYQGGPARTGVRTNGLAITSLVAGIVCCLAVTPIVAVVTGHLALEQIDDAAGAQKGRGMAVAGTVLGWTWLGLVGLGVLGWVISLLATA